MTQELTWNDLYADSPVQDVALDPAGESLLALAPPEMRAQAEPMMRTMLAQIRIQLGERQYLQFTTDMKAAAELHRTGDRAAALALFSCYGWGAMYESLCQQADAV